MLLDVLVLARSKFLHLTRAFAFDSFTCLSIKKHFVLTMVAIHSIFVWYTSFRNYLNKFTPFQFSLTIALKYCDCFAL